MSRTLQEILDASHNPDPEVRRTAARTLGRMRSEEALGALDAARFDPDFSVRRAVLAGLARLENM